MSSDIRQSLVRFNGGLQPTLQEMPHRPEQKRQPNIVEWPSAHLESRD